MTAVVPLRFGYEMANSVFAYGRTSLRCRKQEEGSEGGAGELPSVHTSLFSGRPSLLARETELFVSARPRLIVEGSRDGDEYTYAVARQTLFVLPATHFGRPGSNGSGEVHAQTRMVRVRSDLPVELRSGFWSNFAGPVGATQSFY
ncbi:hypothetical protein BJY52DRAFT_1185016 [Lactarius psammicola]|nr:hypothetical protein BJY52DRAFT_1185016 [Lactarius psammicola]